MLDPKMYKLDGHVFEKLTSTNWTIWMPHARRTLIGRNLWAYVKAEYKDPEWNEALWQTRFIWKQEYLRIDACKNAANSILWGMVSAELHHCVTNIDEPPFMWKALETQASKSAGISAISMSGRLNEAAIDKDGSLTAFFARLTQMRDHLKGTKHAVTDDNFGALIINKCMKLPHLANQCVTLSENRTVDFSEIMQSVIRADKLLNDSRLQQRATIKSRLYCT
jgi:hypothetical protein